MSDEDDRPTITILWGTDKEISNTYVFENETQKTFFMKGVDEANGWLEYEVVEQSNKNQTSKIINAELKNGDHARYLWLGNDSFGQLYDEWDFESDLGKYKGLSEFDVTFSFTVEKDEIKNEESIIGMSFDTDLEGSEIVDFTIEDVIWDTEER